MHGNQLKKINVKEQRENILEENTDSFQQNIFQENGIQPKENIAQENIINDQENIDHTGSPENILEENDEKNGNGKKVCRFFYAIKIMFFSHKSNRITSSAKV